MDTFQQSPIVSTPSPPVSPIVPAADPLPVKASPVLIRVSPARPPRHRWSDYVPYTLPDHEIRRLLRVASGHITEVLRSLTLAPGTRSPDVYAVRQYVEWMCREGQLDPTVLVAAVAYLRALVAAVADTEDVAYDCHVLVATALMLASKIVDDDPLDSKGVTVLLCDRLFAVYDTDTSTYKETLEALNQSEARFLETLDYRVHITHDAYTELWRMLADGSPSEPLMTSPTSVATGVHSLVPCTKPQPLQLLGDLCAATVRRWFAGVSPRP